MNHGRAIATAVLAWAAIALPAWADLDYTLPGGYRAIALKSGSDTLEARGGFVPVVWFGGPTRFFRMDFQLGGAYMADPRGGTYTYAVGQSMINFELPVGFMTPYLGVVGHVAYPFQQPSYVTGFPYGLMPQAGVKFDFAVLTLDLHAGQGPVWGLSRPNFGPYDATMTEVGGRLAFTL